MNNRALTLVELLAVIVVIGIISLITVPFIGDMVNKSRRDSFVDSAYSLVKAAENYYSDSVLDRRNRTLFIDFSEGKKVLSISGELPSSGNLSLDEDGNVELKIWSDKSNICVVKVKDESEILISDLKKVDCHL